MNLKSQQTTKKCPFCAEEIIADAVKCKHCGEWVNKESAGPVLAQSPTQQFSNVQPVWHLVLLSIATFGIYEIYWFYRNWKQLKLHKNF